jgi:4-nitrophenyl phosphatase
MQTDQPHKLQKIRHFLFDLDGTVYLSNTPLPGAVELIELLNKKDISCTFVTNNSSRSASAYVDKLQGMGFPVSVDQVVTSGQVTGWYCAKKKPGVRLYLVGTRALKKELSAFDVVVIDQDDAEVDWVVVGFDTELTYQKLLAAERHLSAGAGFIATNPDLVCPIDDSRFIPDCGSICMMLENATGRQPMFMGKPHTTLFEYIRSRCPIPRETTAMVGDRLYTDIAFAANAGLTGICTLTGESDRAAIEKSPCQPDVVIDSVAGLIPFFS